MKKVTTIIILLLISTGIFVLGFNSDKTYEPYTHYEVYLDAKKIGTVASQTELESYINNEGNEIKNKLKVDKVYAPEGLEIVKVTTYNSKVDDVKTIYDTIAKNSNFTVDGYQFTIKYTNLDSSETSTKKVYTTNKDYFTKAVTDVIESYAGTDKYSAYINGKQVAVTTTGSYTNNIYLADDITVKEGHIDVSNTIYTDADSIAQYLLYGNNPSNIEYTVKDGENIDEIAYNNKVSVNDFLLANPKLPNANVLLYAGQQVNIGVPDPQIHVVVEEYVVQDQEEKFDIDEVYDSSMITGSRIMTQEGSNGTIRVYENVKTVNGIINYVDTIKKEEITPAVNAIVKIGTRYVANIGTGYWGWPTDPGWTISSYYSYRISPITGKAELHDGIDIYSGGYGSNIYAADNGIVMEVNYNYINGNYVIINHQNGYYTYYGHMIRLSDFLTVGQTVERGQVIGHIGSTGYATGPHLHFGMFVGYPYRGGYSINPLSQY